VKIKSIRALEVFNALGEPTIASILTFTKKEKSKIKIVGDDLFATNINRIIKGIELDTVNAVVIKPSQIGTITETLQAIKLCYQHNLTVIISDRSGDTCDSFIADLAVGSNATHIKSGGLQRGEHISKYNRLLEIEDFLMNM